MVADDTPSDEQQAKPADNVANTETPKVVHKTVPRYAVVYWRDATGTSLNKVKTNRITANLSVNISVGRMFTDPDGTIALVHEYQEKSGIERRGELTIIPAVWVVKVIQLIPAEPA